MTIRATENQGIFGSVRSVTVSLRELALGGVDEANAVLIEHREGIDTAPAFITTIPSNDFNGTVE